MSQDTSVPVAGSPLTSCESTDNNAVSEAPNIWPSNQSIPNRGDVLMLFLHLRNTELSSLWARYNIYLALNGGLLGAFLSFRIEGAQLGPLHPLIPMLGLALALVWLRSEGVGRSTLYHRDRDLKAIYDRYFTEFPREEDRFLEYPDDFKRQRYLSLIVISLFILAWGLLIARKMYGY